MLSQQKYFQQQPDNYKILTKISRIEKQTLQFHSLISQIKSKKYTYQPSSIQQQSSISEIQIKSEKVLFDLQVPMDKTMKRIPPILYIDSNNNNNKNYYQSKDKQDGIKYKPRSSVNGRDEIRYKNFSIDKNNIPLQKIVNPYKQCNNNQQNKKLNHKISQYNIQQEDIIDMHKQQYSNRNKKIENGFDQERSFQKVAKFRRRDLSHPNNPQSILNNLTTPNPKANKKSLLLSLNPNKIINQFIQKNENLTPQSSPNQIYQYFTNLCQCYNINIFHQPLIKRYRNCIYFGEKVPKNKKEYQGFVWYYRNSLYYGTFIQGRKNGDGIQIDLERQIQIWKGNFFKGTKTGMFQYTTPTLKYSGMMKNGYFHGEGVLETKNSKYQGNFKAGSKDGYGRQSFFNNVVYQGQYSQGYFEGQGQLEADNYFYKGAFRRNTANGNGFQRTGEYEYVGEFINGKKDGLGTIKMKDGKVIEGNFRDGKLIKQSFNSPTKNYQIKTKINNNNRTNQMNPIITQKYLSNELYALSEQNQDFTIDYDRIKKSSKKIPKYQELLQKEFPQDQLDNEEDPLERKIGQY